MWPEEQRQLAGSEKLNTDAARKAERRAAWSTSHGPPETATFWWASIAGDQRSPDQYKAPRVRRGEQGEASAEVSMEAEDTEPKATLWLVAGGPSVNCRVAVLDGHPGHPFRKEGATPPSPVFSQEPLARLQVP